MARSGTKNRSCILVPETRTSQLRRRQATAGAVGRHEEELEVSEPDISTLARRLAEQNNVDWRALDGSGPDGKVVERDVLDYLARVMSGDEATSPTAEPLPEGMDAWPEQDLHEIRSGVGEAATLGDLRQELADSARPEDPFAPAEDALEGAFGAVESVPLGG